MTPRLPPENARGDVPLGRREITALRAFSTAALCDAIAELAPERRGFGFTTEPLIALRPDLPPVIGYACTATIRTAGPPEDAAAASAGRIAWMEHVARGAKPTVAVVQDVDGNNRARAAFWGEVLAAMHAALGCEGLVTDGAVRDMRRSPPGFAVLAGGARPSHGWAHWVSFGGTVNVAGLTVTDGRTVPVHRTAAVLVPADLVREIPDAVEHARAHNAELLDVCRRPGPGFAALKPLLLGQRQTRWCS